MEALKEALSWLFDGIGTELISLLVGAAVGGFAGYKVGVKKSGKQEQIAKDGAHQKQKLEVDGDPVVDNGRINNSVRQKQRAGNNAVQEQIGSVKRGK